MIFIFVFREAAPIFFVTEQTAVSTTESVTEDETYGDQFLSENARQREAQRKKSTPVETGGGEGVGSAATLLSTHWKRVYLEPKCGLLPLAAGSLKITLLAILIAAPIAIFAALYTSSFAPKWSREVLKPAIEILAGFPSVVIGFFALVFLATLMQNLFGYEYRLNA